MVDDLDVPLARPVARSLRVVPAALLVGVALVLGLLGGAPQGVDTATASTSTGPAAVPADAAAQPVKAASRAQKRAAKRAAAKRAQVRAKARAKAAASQVEPGLDGVAWTGGTVRYHDGLPAQWGWSLRAAVAQWNASGAGVRLVPVNDRSRAQVKIGYGAIGDSAGLATVGRTSGAFVRLSKRYASYDAQDPYYRVEAMAVLTHELGHVLGLDHVANACDLMGTTMDIVGCGLYDMTAPDVYRCDVLGPRPVQLAVRAYGGAAAARPSGSCEVGAEAAAA